MSKSSEVRSLNDLYNLQGEEGRKAREAFRRELAGLYASRLKEILSRIGYVFASTAKGTAMGAITFGHPFKGTIPVVGEVVGTIAASFGVVAGTVAGLLNGIHGALTGMAKTSGRGNMGYRRWREHNTEWRRDINDAEGEIEYPGI